jgi:hypothetical protein
MLRFPLVLSMVCLCGGLQAQTKPIGWIISESAIEKLNGAGAGDLARRWFNNPGTFLLNSKSEDWAATPTANFSSAAKIKEALEKGQVDARIKAVLYDNEAWKFTPDEEKRDVEHIERSEKLAAEAVHRSGRILVATPATDLTSVLSPQVKQNRYDEFLRLGIARAAARYADVYEIQAQGSEANLELFTHFVKEGAAQARSANPKVRVFAGLSTNPSGKRVTADNLLKAIQATRGFVDGYWLNIPAGGAHCPRCGEAQPQVAVEMLKRLE